MKKQERNLLKQPKWVQCLIEEKDYEIHKLQKELEMTQKAHAVLFDFGGWFVIHGPYSFQGEPDANKIHRLHWLSETGSRVACELRRGDVLLVGRKRRDYD